MPGAADYDAADLRARTASLELTGVGHVAVWATERLDVTLNGVAEVVYYGNPEVSQVVNGPGRVTSRGDK
jgi:hypothetical protein